MHEGYETKQTNSRADLAPGYEPNSLRIGKNERPATLIAGEKQQKGFRRRGSDAVVVSLFSIGGFWFDASFPSVHAPWKILIPHNTTTMASISVAAVNTLSKEATLMLLSASQPR